MTAWKDGRVTATERVLVEQLRENLGISKEEQERIENEVLEEVLENRAGIYRAVAAEALDDGPIQEGERELLEALRKKLGLSSHDCREIEAGLGEGAAQRATKSRDFLGGSEISIFIRFATSFSGGCTPWTRWSRSWNDFDGPFLR